jgi:hypothetical protein
MKLKFKFLPDKGPMAHARGWIVLGDHFIDDDGEDLLSPECVNVKEIEYYVKARKAELDKILAKAKTKFKQPN